MAVRCCDLAVGAPAVVVVAVGCALHHQLQRIPALILLFGRKVLRDPVFAALPALLPRRGAFLDLLGEFGGKFMGIFLGRFPGPPATAWLFMSWLLLLCAGRAQHVHGRGGIPCGRHVNGCPALPIPRRRIGAGVKQTLGHVRGAITGRIVQGRGPVLVRRVRVGLGLEQIVHRFGRIGLDGQVQRSPALPIGGTGIGSGLEQFPDAENRPVFSGAMQRGPPLGVGRIEGILNPLVLFRACSQAVGKIVHVANFVGVVGSLLLLVFPSGVVRRKVLDRDTARLIPRLQVGPGFE